MEEVIRLMSNLTIYIYIYILLHMVLIISHNLEEIGQGGHDQSGVLDFVRWL